MIDMYDESSAPAGSVSTAKIGFGIAAIGIFLAFCYPMFASDKEDGMSMLFGKNFDGLTMMYLGAAMMIGGFLLARKQFGDDDNRRGLITMIIAPFIFIGVISFVRSQIEEANSSFEKAMTFYENMETFIILVSIGLSAVFFMLAYGFNELNTWANLKGMKISYIGAMILGCMFALLLFLTFTDGAFVKDSETLSDALIGIIKASPYVGSILLLGGMVFAVVGDCPQLEGDIEEDVYPSSVGAMAYEAASANVPQTPVTNPWTSMTSADLLGVLTNHASYTRPELEEVAMELYKRHDEHYLSAFRAMDSTALEAIIKSPASHLHAEVLAAADALATR